MPELLFDAWTPMSFKRALGDRRVAGVAYTAPTWADYHSRRLQAYTILQAYVDNAGREFMAITNDEERAAHREYGDAALLRNAVLSAVMGEDQRIVVPGSEEDSSDEARLQEWLEAWADDERFGIKMMEAERDAVGLGDGVYVLGWSARKNRPRLRVYDPGFYFPVIDDGNDDEYPRKVHIAWELPEVDGRKRVRRMTWELAPLGTAPDPDNTDELPEGVDADPDTGQLTQRLPWNDEPTSMTCYYTDAIWELEASVTVEDLSESAAEYLTNEDGLETNRLDLGIDFVPIVHVPNTVAVKEHYGRSALAYVLQIIDDLSNADTDLQAASATTGTPPISLSGATMGDKQLTYKPGQVFETGDNGRMDVLDTSRSLDALLKYVEALLDRLSVNGRTPAALLGRVDPSEVPSGIALTLSFGPLSSMVREMRLARDDKYALLLRFAQRLAAAGGDPEVPQLWDARARLELGSFLPSDLSGAVEMVARLLEVKAISVETAIATLMDAGMAIEDAAAEVELIQSRDFEGANALLDATGSSDEVASYLGREAQAIPPRPTPPPVGSQPPPQPPPAGAERGETT